MTRRKIVVRAGLAAFGLCLSLGLIEVGLRLSGVRRQFARADSIIGYVLTADYSRAVPITDPPAHAVTLRTNNLGIRRDENTSCSKAAHAQRVIVLGDSQSEGIVDNRDTYSARLEKLLESGDAQGEVLNAAVSGYSPLLELLWWRERGSHLAPDVVVLAIYSGNDIGELLMHHEDFGGFGPLFSIPYLAASAAGFRLELPGSETGMLGRVDYVLKSWSRAYALARRVIRRRTPAEISPLTPLAAQCPGCFQSVWQEWLAVSQPTSMDDGFARLTYVLDELQRDTQRRGIRLILAVIPTKLQVEPTTVATAVHSVRTQLGLPSANEGVDETVHQRIIAAGLAHGLPTVDLLPMLRTAHEQSGAELYWRQDWHLNPAGHAAVAAALLPIVGAELEQVRSKTSFP